MIIIFISGYLQSGKDTVGNFLVKKYDFIRLAFADELKNEVSKLYNIDRLLMDTSNGKKQSIDVNIEGVTTVRDLLICHGKSRRDFDEKYWALKIVDKIHSLSQNGHDKFVISDWRFYNEYQTIVEDPYIKSNDGRVLTWRINRWDIPPSTDESEISLDKFNFDKIIDNKQIQQQDLYEKIQCLMNEH